MGRFLQKHWAAITGMALTALYIYLQLVQWQLHGDDLMLTAANIVITVGLWTTLLTGIFHYRRETGSIMSSLGAQYAAKAKEVEEKYGPTAFAELQAKYADDKLHLTIHEAQWGTAVDRISVAESLSSQTRNALMLRVTPDVFPGPDPAWGDDSKYVEVTYSHSGSGGRQTVTRKQGQWLLLPEDPVARTEIASLTQRLQRMKGGMLNLQNAGELHAVADESLYLRSKLLEIEETAKQESDEAALLPLKRPLSVESLPKDALWKCYHKALWHFQRLYEFHRIRVMNSQVHSDVVANAVIQTSVVDFQQVVTMLEKDRDALLARQREIVVEYNNI